MKYTVIALLVVLLLSAVAFAQDGFSVSFLPDNRAPSIFIACNISTDLSGIDLSLASKFGAWWYVNNPPTGYNKTFYTISFSPKATFQLFAGWECRLVATLQYRTNLPNKVLVMPEIELWHSW